MLQWCTRRACCPLLSGRHWSVGAVGCVGPFGDVGVIAVLGVRGVSLVSLAFLVDQAGLATSCLSLSSVSTLWSR